MKSPELIPHSDLIKLANRITDILYFDADTESMNPNKEWEIDFLEYIDAEMEALGLKPRFHGDDFTTF